MRVVAVQAILAHGCVLEQDGPALLRVALVAIVVDRDFPDEPLGGAAVRVMTVRAGDLALTHGHVRRTEDLRLPVLVALEAGVGLPRRLELVGWRHVLHDGMAVGAGNRAFLVHTAAPVDSLPALMAVETNGVVVFDPARGVGLAERNDPAHAAAIGGGGGPPPPPGG